MTQLPSSTCDEMFSIPLYWTKFYVTESFTIASSVKYSTAKSANTFLPVYVLCSQFKNQPTIVYLVHCTLYKALYMMALYMEAFLLIFSCLDLGGFSTLSMTSRLLILTKKQEELNDLKHDSNYPSLFTVASGTV